MTTTTDTTDPMYQHRIKDTQRRIRNILKVYPAGGMPGTIRWSLWESEAVLAVISAIYLARDDHGGLDDVRCLSGRLTTTADELRRLANVMMCDRCDTGGWTRPPRPEVPSADFVPEPIRCQHQAESA